MNLKLFRPDETDEPDDEMALIEAVLQNDVNGVRQRLADGAPVDTRQDGRDTVLMMAAARGHTEIFQTLLDAGADPYLDIDLGAYNARDDALSVACRSGRTSIVREWTRRGLDISSGSSIDDPLLAAVVGGHVEVVQLLIDAGADVNAEDADRNTPLAWALVNDQQQTAQVLRQAGAVMHADCRLAQNIGDPLMPELDDRLCFAVAADEPPFQQLVRELIQTSESEPHWSMQPSAEFPGVWQIDVRGPYAPPSFDQLRADIWQQGYHLVHTSLPAPGTRLLLFPTVDKYQILAALETNGENYSISDRRVRAWLREMEQEHPFVLLGAAIDFVDGQFINPVQSPNELAHSMYEFCPDIVDQGCGSVGSLASELQRSGRFVLWWD